MSAQFTPGPWFLVVDKENRPCVATAEPDETGYVDGYWIAECVFGVPPADDIYTSTTANARLIAAAPELLDALQRLSAQCDRMRLLGQSESDAEKNAKAAIAKAEGGAA